MKVLKHWNIKGNDGTTYQVEKWAVPAMAYGVGMSMQREPSIQWVVLGGGELVEHVSGCWEIVPSGVLLPKPADA